MILLFKLVHYPSSVSARSPLASGNSNDLLIWTSLDGTTNGSLLMAFLFVFFNLMLALSLSGTWISAIVPIIAHSVVSKLPENTECVAP